MPKEIVSFKRVQRDVQEMNVGVHSSPFVTRDGGLKNPQLSNSKTECPGIPYDSTFLLQNPFLP